MEEYEHPDITSALRTGYPRWNQPSTVCICDRCGYSVEGVFNQHRGKAIESICKDCLMEELNSLDNRLLAEVIGAEYIEAEEY